jgi:hypothetical protein
MPHQAKRDHEDDDQAAGRRESPNETGQDDNKCAKAGGQLGSSPSLSSSSSSRENAVCSAAESCSLTIEPDSGRRDGPVAHDGHPKHGAGLLTTQSSNQLPTDSNNNNDSVGGPRWPGAADGALSGQQDSSLRPHHKSLAGLQVAVCSLSSANLTTNTYDESSLCGALDKPGLLYCCREALRLKDFKTEVRAIMDVEQFCHQSELLLDPDEMSMSGIIEAMLAKVVVVRRRHLRPEARARKRAHNQLI